MKNRFLLRLWLYELQCVNLCNCRESSGMTCIKILKYILKNKFTVTGLSRLIYKLYAGEDININMLFWEKQWKF